MIFFTFDSMYSVEQISALAEARRVLDNAGLTSESSRLANISHSEDFDDSQAVPAPPAISQAYQPQPTYWFTSEDFAKGHNSVNRQTKIDGIVYHPSNAIVEYLETGATLGVSVGHIFSVDPQEFHHPRHNIQYSQGDVRGGRAYAACNFLYDDGTGIIADCKNEKNSCELASSICPESRAYNSYVE